LHQASAGDTYGQPARADVDEVSQWVRRRGSTTGAAIGVAAGFVAGFAVAAWAAADESGRNGFLAPLAIIGMPIAGGLLGYRSAGDKLTTIYLRP